MPIKESPAGNKPVERVFLIDSMSHIFRAFYAPMMNRVAPLSNSKGQVTQAVYIFTNMLRKLLQDEKPNYIAAIFESKEKTFRHETFADYKANRLAMPEDLASQLPYIFRLCEAFNIPVINAPGFEADDVIGTLAGKMPQRSCRQLSFQMTKTCANWSPILTSFACAQIPRWRNARSMCRRSNGAMRHGWRRSLACRPTRWWTCWD